MTVLHEDLQIKDFVMPEGVEELTYCTKTGLLATDQCKKTDVGYYKTVFKPDVCTCGVVVPEQPTDPTTPSQPTESTTITGDPSTTTGNTTPTESTGSTDPIGTTLPSVPVTTTPVTPGEDENNIPTP